MKSAIRLPAQEASCREMAADFIKPDLKNFNAEDFNHTKLQLDISRDQLAHYLSFFTEFNLNQFSNEQLRTMRSIYLFSQGDFDMRKDLVAQFIKILKNESVDPKNKIWARFTAHQKKVQKYTDKKMAKAKTPEAKTIAKEQSLLYEKLYFSCKAHTQKAPSAVEMRRAKHLTYALTAGAITSTGVTYSAMHYDEEKDAKWLKGLGFEIALTAIFTYVGGTFVTSNPKMNPWTVRAPLSYLNAAVADLGPSGAYSFIFNSTDEEIKKKFEEMKKDPKVQEEIAELLHYAQENKLFEKHAAATEKLFSIKPGSKLTAEQMLQSLDLEKIDLEETRELLFAAIADREYSENAGILKTGMPGTDRYAFHRAWTLGSVPYNIGLALLMHNQLCMTADPKAGFAKAIATYFMGQILLDSVYYKSRREVINQ